MTAMPDPTDPLEHPDRAAVMAVIERETEMFIQQDFEGWAACWVQDSRAREVCISSSLGSTVLEGWDTLRDYMRQVIETGAVCDISGIARRNVVMTLSGDMAHVVYDETGRHRRGHTEHTFETRVLERSDGVWRILYAAFMLRGHQQIDETRLAVNARGEVLCAPEAARAQLAKHPGLQISNNRLRATRPAWDKILQTGLACAAEQHGYFQHYRYMAESGRNFRLPLVLGETDEGRVAICVLFVRDGLTFVETQQEGDIHARLTVAKALFGLSDGQMALARCIVHGDTLTSAAKSLGISVNTARTHLSRIYGKTGVHSQTALVRILLSVG